MNEGDQKEKVPFCILRTQPHNGSTLRSRSNERTKTNLKCELFLLPKPVRDFIRGLFVRFQNRDVMDALFTTCWNPKRCRSTTRWYPLENERAKADLKVHARTRVRVLFLLPKPVRDFIRGLFMRFRDRNATCWNPKQYWRTRGCLGFQMLGFSDLKRRCLKRLSS